MIIVFVFLKPPEERFKNPQDPLKFQVTSRSLKFSRPAGDSSDRRGFLTVSGSFPSQFVCYWPIGLCVGMLVHLELSEVGALCVRSSGEVVLLAHVPIGSLADWLMNGRV